MAQVAIASKQNERIKQIRKLYTRKFRKSEGLFVAEGIRLVEELVKTLMVEQVFFAESFIVNPRGQALLKTVHKAGIPSFSCTEEVFSHVCDTKNAQGVLAVVRKPEPCLDWSHQGNRPQDFILIVDQVQDPGNLGTILRTAVAAGVTGIWIIGSTVDVFSPKVIRSSMGSIFHLPYVTLTTQECLTKCQELGLKLIATDVHGGVEHYNCSLLVDAMALVVGNEGNGVSPLLLEHSDQRIYIPLANDVESLNVAVATAVLLYETVRQRAFR